MTRPRRATPHLFRDWESIAHRIQESGRVAIFLDFDGTLAPVSRTPESARVTGEARRALQTLEKRRNVSLTVISGRQRAELRRLVGLHNVNYLGLYGWERNGNSRLPLQVQSVLDRSQAGLQFALSKFPGVWVEPKRSCYAVHLVGAKAEIQPAVRRAVSSHLKPLRQTLRVFSNLRDMEVVPLLLGDKGVAVKEVLAEPGLRGALPVYFGDDFSDEPAFAAVRRGISILVGERRPTKAQFFLRGPEEVAAALSRMEAILR